MKIGIVEAGLPPHRIGGAQKQAWVLAQHLGRRHDVVVFTKRISGLKDDEVINDVRIVRTPVAPFPLSFVAHLFHSTRIICKMAKDLDVLLCFRATPGGVIGRLVYERVGLTYCVSIRGGDWYFVQPRRWGKILIKGVFSRCGRVIAQTPRVAAEIQKDYPQIVPAVIPNGIDAGDRAAQGESLIFVGNLLRRKGVHVLVEAMKGLPEIPVVIAGEGPERDSLEQTAQGLNIEFVGRLNPDEVLNFMITRGRILVLPAVAGEGMPNVLMEALSVGLPVISSDVAGVQDLLDDGACGTIVPPADVTALREAIRTLWHDAPLRMQLALAGKKTVEKYAWETVTAQYEALLADISRAPTISREGGRC